MHNLGIKKPLNLYGINPENSVGRCGFDVKRHKLMIRRVVNSFLNSTGSFDILGMISWPEPSKVLSINLDDFNFRICFLHLVENMLKMVMNFSDKIPGVQETLSEIITGLLARNRNLLRKKISPSTIPCNFIPTVIVDRKV